MYVCTYVCIGMYQYYVKVVPTRYKYLAGNEIESNQYAVTEHMRHLSPGSGAWIDAGSICVCVYL